MVTLVLISFHRCMYHPGAFGRGQTKALQCTEPKIGRYVFVRLRVTEYLTLCEVEVYAVGGMFSHLVMYVFVAVRYI